MAGFLGMDTNPAKGPARTGAMSGRDAAQKDGTWIQGGAYNRQGTIGELQASAPLLDEDPIFGNLAKGEALAKRQADFGYGSNNSAEANAAIGRADDIGQQYGGAFNGLASQNEGRAEAAGARGLGMYAGDTTQFDQGLANATDARAKQGSSYDALMGFANQGPGPSAAQAQLTQATDANTQNALAMARSGRGMGGGQAAMRQALAQNANTQQQSAGQMAELRANENTAFQNQRLNALNAGGGLASQIAGTDQGYAGQGLAGAQYATDTKLKGTQLNDASAQNWATQQGNSLQQGLGAEMGAETQKQNVNASALAGRENEYASANSTYATEKGLAQAASIADANRQQAYTGAALSTAGTVMGALSDERAKKNIRPLSTWGNDDDPIIADAFAQGLQAAGASLGGAKPGKVRSTWGTGDDEYSSAVAERAKRADPVRPTVKEAAGGAFDPIAHSDMVRGEAQPYTFGDTHGAAEYWAPAQRHTGPHTSINPANNPYLLSDARSKQDINPLGGPPGPMGAASTTGEEANGSAAGKVGGPSLAQQDAAQDEKAGQTGQTVGSVAGGATFGPVGAIAGGAIGKAIGKVFSDVRGKDSIVPLADSPKAVEQYANASPKALGKFSRGDHPILSQGDALLANSTRAIPGSVYEYKDPEAPGAKPGKQVGPMAQDLAANPLTRGTVIKDRSGKLGVDTPRLTLYNTAAQHAQQNQLDDLNSKIDGLAGLLKRKPGDDQAYGGLARGTGGL